MQWNVLETLRLDSRGSLRALAMMSAAALLVSPVPVSGAETDTDVDITIVPYVSFEYIGSNVLFLEIPPMASTVNSPESVIFKVTGNARATMSAAPSEFILIPGSEGGWMGQAMNGSEPIGYQLQLTFPRTAVFGSPKKIESLPLDAPTGTPPLSVNLQLTSGSRQGAIDLLADPAWTLHGGLPAAGLYVGQITLTVAAENL